METKKEKKNAGEMIIAILAKSIDEIATEDLNKIIAMAGNAMCNRAMMLEQAAKGKCATMMAKLPDRSSAITPPMMRRAIEKAFELEAKDSHGRVRRVFSTKKNWLAVYRVLQYLGIVEGDSHYQKAVNYIMNTLFGNGVPIPEAMNKKMPNANALSVAGSEKGLNQPLEKWLDEKHEELLGDYLLIARCILESITDEMRALPQKA